VRLCYAGPALHARPPHPLASREPIQVGAELYGDAAIDADGEVLQLAARSLELAGAAEVRIDLGHSGVLRAILSGERLAADRLDDIVWALNSKDLAALKAAGAAVGRTARDGLLRLADLHGEVDVLARARRDLPASGELTTALNQLEQLAALCPAGSAGIDLADLHGYRYYTGATFAAYVADSPGPILRGGRYDEIGRFFGRARPATGFSIVDLREAARLGGPKPLPKAIVAPYEADRELDALVAALRAQGQIVVRAADGRLAEGGFEFDRDIRRIGTQWQVIARDPKSNADRSGRRDAG